MKTDTPNKAGPFMILTDVTRKSSTYRGDSVTGYQASTDRYDTRDEAVAAATRAAKNSRSKTFIVVHVEAAVSTVPVYETRIDITGEGATAA